MPNHVTSRIIISGPAERLREFKAKHIVPVEHEGKVEDDPTLNFETVIPKPDIIKRTESSSDVDHAHFAMTGEFQYFNPLESPWVKELGITTREEFKAWLEKEKPQAFEKYAITQQAIAETGCKDWYDWSLNNWGTKWNSYSFREAVNTFEHPGTSGREIYEFVIETAWSPPNPVLKKLAELYPDLEFQILSFDEGWNFAQAAAGKNGQFHAVDLPATDEVYEKVYGEAPPREEE